MNDLNLFIPLTKVDVAQRLVYGTLAAEMPDHSGEIMDYETAKPAFKEWSDNISKATDGKSVGNVRAMHTSVAAGKLISIDFDDDNKAILGCAKISDDNEWNKVLDGVYTGFSLGGSYRKRWACPANASLKRYTPTVAEVSIVDNPCIPSATFNVIKADGSTELRKFKVATEAESDIEQVWRSKKDGECFLKKAEAQSHNLDLVINKATATVADALESLKKAQEAMKVEDIDAAGHADGDLKDELVTGKEDTLQTEPKTDADGVITSEDTSVADKAAAITALAKKVALAKALCDIPMLVDVLSSLNYLQSGLEWDAMFDDNATTGLPANLKDILASLCDFLKLVVEDATADITTDSAKAAGLTIEQVESIRKAVGNADLMKDFAVEPPVDLTKMLAERDEAIAKVTADLQTEKQAKSDIEAALGLMKAGIDDATKCIGELKSEIAVLKKQPMPTKGKAHVTVTKGHEGDATGAESSPVEADMRKYNGLSPEERRRRIAQDRATQAQ